MTKFDQFVDKTIDICLVTILASVTVIILTLSIVVVLNSL